MGRLRVRHLLPLGIVAALIVTLSATNVTILKTSAADDGGVFLRPYYENLNAPVTGCASPCLAVDTQGTEPAAAGGTLSLDSHGIGGNNPSPSTVSVSTTDTNDVIVVMVMCNPGVTAMSISGGGLVWNTRLGVKTIGSRTGAEFWAFSAAAISTPVTVSITYTSGSACNPAYLAINGANTNSPFDSNGALPAVANANTPATCTVSTSNADDMLFGYMMQGGAPTSYGVPTGWIGPLNTFPDAAHWDAYDIASSTVSSQSETWTAPNTSSPNISGFCDAVRGENSFTLAAGSSMYLWSPQFSSATSIPAGSLSLQVFADAPAPALDGSATGTWTSGSTFTIPSLTTTKTNDVVVLSIDTYSSGSSVTVSSITDSLGKIAWQGSARSSFIACSGVNEITVAEWYGIAATAVSSDTVSVHLASAPTGASGIAFGVSGADTTTPFDSSSGLPKTATACSGTAADPTVSAVSTLADNDFVFSLFGGYTSTTETAGSIGVWAASSGSPVTGTGYSNAVQYAKVPNSQASDSCTFGTATTYWGVLCDALVPARQSIGVSYYTTNSAGAVQSTMASDSAATLTSLYQPASISSSAGAVPASGYVEVVITAPSTAALTIIWGAPKPTLFEVSYTYRA